MMQSALKCIQNDVKLDWSKFGASLPGHAGVSDVGSFGVPAFGAALALGRFCGECSGNGIGYTLAPVCSVQRQSRLLFQRQPR